MEMNESIRIFLINLRYGSKSLLTSCIPVFRNGRISKLIFNSPNGKSIAILPYLKFYLQENQMEKTLKLKMVKK